VALYPSTAAAEAPSIEVVPTSVAVVPGGDAKGSVYLRNDGDAPVRITSLDVLGDGANSPTTSFDEPAPAVIAPKQTVEADLLVHAPEALTSARKLTLLARYSSSGESGTTSTTLEVTPSVPRKASDVASVELHASLATLKSDEQSTAYLTIQNLTQLPIDAGPVEAFKPGFLSFPDLATEPVPIAGLDTVVIPIVVKAGQRVDPGDYQIVFRVPVSSGGESFAVTTASSVAVGVQGEADVLAIIGVPSLLLAPGILAIAMASLLSKLGICRPRYGSSKMSLEPKSPEFWLVAVFASTVLTPLMGALLGISYLGAYGIEDLLILWVASIVAGAACYAIAVVALWIYRVRYVPSASDDQIDTLRKLGRRGLGVMRDRFAASEDDDAAISFLLEERDAERPTSWFSPAIEYAWVGDEIDGDLDGRIGRAMDSDDAGDVAAALESGRKARLITVVWAASGGPSKGPKLIAREKEGTDRGKAPIVEEA
jgi:hypothetical protein